MIGIHPIRRWRRFFVFCGLIAAISFSAAAWADEEEDERHGSWLERAEGGHLFFYIEEGNIFLEFYDSEKERVAPDARRAAVHYTPQGAGNRETVVLSPGREDGDLLTSSRHVRPPYLFQIVLILVKDEAGRETETFSFRYRPEETD